MMWIAWRRLLYPYADVVTANLAASVADMARYVPEARLTHVPNPVEYPEDNELALPQHSRRIVSVGRLVPSKRHRMLIEMFGVLSDDLDGWELDIVGEGPMRSELEQQIKACGLGGRVHLHGQRHDVEAFYRAAAIFILPSSVEGTPNALLEAMAHALPCVVSDAVTGAGEYLEEGINGYAFRQDSSADLAERMRSLVRAPERREAMGRRARERILAKSQDSAYAVWDRVIGLAMKSGPDAYNAS
jgi:glycosyltransferase involved in cell wall biosynthesis